MAFNCLLSDLLNSADRPRPLDFDPEKHKILNSELKHLYTAVTRARVNIWIFDEDEEARKPMFEYFKALKFVQSVEVNDGQEAQKGKVNLKGAFLIKLLWPSYTGQGLEFTVKGAQLHMLQRCVVIANKTWTKYNIF